MGLTSWRTESFFLIYVQDTKKDRIRRAILKKVSYNKYNQFYISAMKGITKNCLSSQYERSM